MYRRVLLAYDGSREGRAALREGAMVVKTFASRVFLLCVTAEPVTVRAPEAAHAEGFALEAAADLFAEAMARMRELGFEPEGGMVVGEPAAEIARHARQFQADLVVVGHRKKSLIERWWSGSSGAYLVDHLDCSLLVARRPISDEEFYGVLGIEPPTPPPSRR
jgi:nucleotide-binding universal stress UspA family protein